MKKALSIVGWIMIIAPAILVLIQILGLDGLVFIACAAVWFIIATSLVVNNS